MSRDDLARTIDWADVVIAHCGVGSALSVLKQGKSPLLVPRRASHEEHVDDHQELIGRELEARGLATVREADSITRDDLLTIATRRVTSTF
jgi:UDP-N-acetylglucosamine--N-acetylmuramyl-(pentapeptide) pyrophosphoryl-undecaprenol N-acetylglucosamine transferase